MLVTTMLLEQVGEVFNSNDINVVMERSAPNAIFNHASGSKAYGIRFEGLDESTSTKPNI